MAQYGLILTPEQTKQQLRELNRDYYNRQSWAGYESGLASAAALQSEQLSSATSDVVSRAYTASQYQNRQLNASGLVGQERNILREQNRQALEEAYQTYMSQYNKGMQSIQEGYEEGMQTIDEALTDEATNITNYRERHFDYLRYLYDQYKAGKNKLFDNIQWQKFLNEDDTLKTKEQLMGQTHDKNGNLIIDPNALYDAEGYLTLAGADFFDQLENQPANLGLADTWGSFLANTDVDYLMGTYGYTQSEAEKVAAENAALLEWSQTYNPYDYTEAGTHGGSFKTLHGMTSADYTYSFAERLGGLDKGSVSKLYSKFEERALELANMSGKDKAATITKSISGMVDELKSLTHDLGIDKALQEEGLDWDSIKSLIVQYQNAAMSGGAMASQWLATLGGHAGIGAITGGSIGAKIGAIAEAGNVAMPGLGTMIHGASTAAGTIIGSIIGGIIGIVHASINTDSQRKQNLEVADVSRKTFDDVLTRVTNYTANLKRQKDIEWAARNA